VLTLPTYVGIVPAVLQYGAIPFLTTFAVTRWGISAAAAATVLIVGRLLSIVAKIAGGASADRIGARASARRTSVVLTVTGLAWVLLPGGLATYAIAAVFAAMVSSLAPMANILAVESFGENGMALGMYRSVQIALGAAASAVVGVVRAHGLRPALAVAMLVPLTCCGSVANHQTLADQTPSAIPTVPDLLYCHTSPAEDAHHLLGRPPPPQRNHHSRGLPLDQSAAASRTTSFGHHRPQATLHNGDVTGHRPILSQRACQSQAFTATGSGRAADEARPQDRKPGRAAWWPVVCGRGVG
jgi:hypothetical protein